MDHLHLITVIAVFALVCVALIYFVINDIKGQRKENEVFWSFMDTISNRAKTAPSSDELFELRPELK